MKGGVSMPDLIESEEIKKRIRKLKRTYKDLPKEKMLLAEPLIKNAAFMEVQLYELQRTIEQNGTHDDYQNGANQFGKKISADLQAYNSLIKSYNMVNQRLENMLPEEKKTESKLAKFKSG